MPEDAADWLQRLAQVESPDSSWKGGGSPRVLAEGAGSEVYDTAGKRYIDLCAGFGALPLGHNHPGTAAVFAGIAGGGRRPLVHGMGDVYSTPDKVRLLEKLMTFLPADLGTGSLSLSGGQAVEYALKTAILKTGHSGFIAFDGGYHGLDLGVLPVTARAEFAAPFHGWLKQGLVRHLPFGAPAEAIAAAAAELQSAGHGLAGILVEPVQGRGGIHQAPAGWLATLAAQAEAAGALLIYDEVFAGLGRTGVWTHAEEAPADLVCFGKALGGGLPLSVCVGRREVMAAWPECPGEALHTGTFFGHPLSCRLGLAVLEILADENLVDRSARLGNWLRQHLQDEAGHDPGVREIRGRGLFVGIEFREPGRGAELMHRLRQRGVLALASGDHGECLSLTPALNIPRNLLGEAAAIVVEQIGHAG